MRREWVERMHDQRTEMGYCVQDAVGNWCSAHESLKFPGEEACRAQRVAYAIAESAGEVMGDLIAEAIHDTPQVPHESVSWMDGWDDGMELATLIARGQR
jgi:hypothetical protein